ncbi:MAG: DUF6036 family nucleotidyltransferase [Bdellovibrionota bacterium]
MFLIRLTEALRQEKVAFALVGGFAVSLHGAPRGTLDVDIVLEHTEKNFEACEKALVELGLASKLPVNASEVFKFKDEYINNRNLIAWSFVNSNNPLELVDIVLTQDLKNVSIKKIKIQDTQVPLISLKDLISMKETTGRPQDIEDVKILKELK